MSLRTVLRTEVKPGIIVRVRRDSGGGEYRVETVRKGKVRESETYYTTDRGDAHDTHLKIVTRLLRKGR